MKALSKDPLRRHQSMEELHEELQRCYGSVRYRRSIERSVAEAGVPLPVKRNSVQVSGTILTPTGTPQVRIDGVSPGAAGAAPILLTRKKERPRRTTLPLELQPDPAALEKTPPPVVNGAVEAVGEAVERGHDEWSEPARPENENNWAELDIDAPDGTSG